MWDREYERERGRREKGARTVTGGARRRARNDFNICSHTLYVSCQRCCLTHSNAPSSICKTLRVLERNRKSLTGARLQNVGARK